MKKLLPVKYLPGTIKDPQHTKLTEAAFVETNHVHFPHNSRLASTLPVQAYTLDGSVYGSVRVVHGYLDASQNQSIVLGSSYGLYGVINSAAINITPFATSGTTLGSNPLAMVDTTPDVTVTHTAHGMQTGDRVKISGVSGTINGIPDTDLNAEHIITYVDANSYTVTVATDATATASGGGASVVATLAIAAGYVDAFLPSGYGAGDYGADLYGSDLAAGSGVAPIPPRFWSMDDFGTDLIINPGYGSGFAGSSLYIWDGDYDVAPTVIATAPTDCGFYLTLNNAGVALCGDTIKISSIGDILEFDPLAAGSTAYANQLQRIKVLISGIRYGEKSAVIYSEKNAMLLQYVGGDNLWDLADIPGNTAGIVGAYACCNLNGVVYWRSKDDFYRYAGGYVELLPNLQNGDWINRNLNRAQESKVVMVPDPAHNQWYCYFPTGTATENSDYVIYNPANNSFTLGEDSRTAAPREPIANNWLLAAYDAGVEMSDLYQHYITSEVLPVTWSAKTADRVFGDGNERYAIDQFVPDASQSSAVSVVYGSKENLQATTETQSAIYNVPVGSDFVSVVCAGKATNLTLSGTEPFTMGAWKERVFQLGRRR